MLFYTNLSMTVFWLISGTWSLFQQPVSAWIFPWREGSRWRSQGRSLLSVTTREKPPHCWRKHLGKQAHPVRQQGAVNILQIHLLYFTLFTSLSRKARQNKTAFRKIKVPYRVPYKEFSQWPMSYLFHTVLSVLHIPYLKATIIFKSCNKSCETGTPDVIIL